MRKMKPRERERDVDRQTERQVERSHANTFVRQNSLN